MDFRSERAELYQEVYHTTCTHTAPMSHPALLLPKQVANRRHEALFLVGFSVDTRLDVLTLSEHAPNTVIHN